MILIGVGGWAGFAVARRWNWQTIPWRRPPATLDCLTQMPGVSNYAWSALRITGGSGDFATVDEADKVVASLAGGPLRGTVELKVAMHVWPMFHTEMVGVPTWGRARNSFWRIAWTAPHTVAPVSLRAPAAAGTYHIVFAMGLEMDAAQVASGNNWADPSGQLLWSPRSEIAAWRPGQIEQAQRFGCAITESLSPSGKYRRIVEPADAVTVIVR